MLPDVLGILITSKCNIICRHCCNESHPKATTVMSFSDIDKLIEEAGKSQNFREIGISGGEPFLFLDLLYNICNSAAKRKLSCSVTTNAFWARSNDSAVKILGQLKSAGLSALNVSTSIFHQEFINLSKVTTAVRAALELNLAARVNYVASSASEVEFALREKLGDLTDHIKIEVMPCLPVGRGGNSMSKEEILQVRESPSGNCAVHFRKMAIDPFGDVYPCCSPGGFTPPLRLGNVENDTLQTLMRRAETNRLLAVLETVGPGFFLPFLRQKTAGTKLSKKFTDQCHLCHEILSDESYHHIIMNAVQQLFDEVNAFLPEEVEASSSPAEILSKLSLDYQ